MLKGRNSLIGVCSNGRLLVSWLTKRLSQELRWQVSFLNEGRFEGLGKDGMDDGLATNQTQEAGGMEE